MGLVRKILILLALSCATLSARQRLQGDCEQGNKTITVSGIPSAASAPVQRSYPSCTVTAYLTGTLTLATLYADNSGTSKANPFTADSTGHWFFYADDGEYDVKFNAGGIPSPFTYSDYTLLDWTFTQPGAPPFTSGAVARSLKLKAADFLNVKDFGAKCDGSTDDTNAISVAITAAIAANARVSLPVGVCIISPPSATQILPIASNVAIQGAGVGISILRVKASGGSYKAVFGPQFIVASYITLSDFTIDQNSANNPAPSGADLTTNPRDILSVGTGGSNVMIRNLEVLNIQSVNTFFIQAVHSSITNTRFTVYGGGTIWHDHSTIYMAADGATVIGNHFTGVVNGAGSTTAIETHGGHQAVTGNVIDRYWLGMNITGVELTDANGIAVTGNTITNGYYGVQVWSSKYQTHTSGFGIDNAVIASNSIKLTQIAWTTNPASGAANIGNPSGIFLNSGANLPFRNVNISSNTVSFDLEPDGTSPWDTSGFGIGYWDSTGANTIDTLKISNNTVYNCPGPGIRFASNGQNVDISYNVLVNVGSSLNAGAIGAYRTGIFLAGTITALAVTGNQVTDTNATSRLVYSSTIATTNTGDIAFRNNIFSVTGATATSFLAPWNVTSGTQLPTINDTIYAPNSTNTLPTNTVTADSTVFDLNARKTYRVRSGGSTWNVYSVVSARPVSACSIGDFAWNDSPTTGTPFGGASPVIGWSCISSGSWFPLTALDTNDATYALTFANNKQINWENAAGSGFIPGIRLDASNLYHISTSGYPLYIDGGSVIGGGEIVTVAGQVSIGANNGVGGGALGNIQAPAQSGGGGPVTAGTIVKWLKISLQGAVYWIPLAQ